MSPTAEREYIHATKAAACYGVSVSTLKRWAKCGRLTAYKPIPGRVGRLMLSVEELDALFAASAVSGRHADGCGGVGDR